MADEKKKRNAKGEGSLKFDAKKQKWVARITARRADGSTFRPRFEGKTQAEARKKRDEWKRLHETQPAGKREKAYLSDYITEWLLTVKKGSVKPSTLNKDLQEVNRNIIPYIGNIRLVNLDAQTIQQEIINRMRDMQDEDGTAHFSFNEIKHAYAPLSQCLKYAAAVGDIPSNPCVNVKLPKHTDEEANPLSNEDVRRFLAACNAKTSKYWWLFEIMLYTGMREGEVSALKPSDVHLDDDYIDVHGTIVINVDAATGEKAQGYIFQNDTKTSRNRRAYFGDTAKALLEERLKRCPEDCYLANLDVTPVPLSSVSKAFQRICKAANIQTHHRPHDLRHTCATELVRMGEGVKTVAKQLGHSTTRTTLHFYVHPSEDDKAEAMKKLDMQW